MNERSILTGVGVAFAVFLLVVITATLITFIMPESFASTVRVRVSTTVSDSPNASEPYDPALIPTEIEVIRSEAILGQVIQNLDLNTKWGQKYAGGERLRTSESVNLLKKRMELKPVGNTRIIEIRCFSENPMEAAHLANSVAAAYSAYAQGRGDHRVEIVDSALPALRPIRPNKILNISIGMALGLLAGAACGLLAAWASSRRTSHTAPINRVPPLPHT